MAEAEPDGEAASLARAPGPPELAELGDDDRRHKAGGSRGTRRGEDRTEAGEVLAQGSGDAGHHNGPERRRNRRGRRRGRDLGALLLQAKAGKGGAREQERDEAEREEGRGGAGALDAGGGRARPRRWGGREAAREMREEGELRAGRCVRRERAREMRSGKEGGEGIEGSGRERIGRRELVSLLDACVGGAGRERGERWGAWGLG